MNFNPDLFIASSTYPFDCIPLKKIADDFNAKLCFEVHDLWPLSPIEFGGYSKYHPFIMPSNGLKIMPIKMLIS